MRTVGWKNCAHWGTASSEREAGRSVKGHFLLGIGGTVRSYRTRVVSRKKERVSSHSQYVMVTNARLALSHVNEAVS